MSLIKILIVENDSSFASSLKINLKKWGTVDISILKSVAEAHDFIQYNQVDLIITKPTLVTEGDGVEFGGNVLNRSCPVVFIAEESEKIFYDEAKKLNLLSFIIRPFDFKTLYAALNIYFDDKDNFLIIIKGKNKLRVRYSKINWIKSVGNYCLIRTDRREYSMKISLTKLKNTFLDQKFIQIHRAFIVRIDKVSNINVKMNKVNINQTELPIGRKYRKDFFNKIDII